MARCPNCSGLKYQEDNGCKRSSPNYTLLCLRPVEPEMSASFLYMDERHIKIKKDAQGKIPCATQWCPNDNV